LIWDFRFLYLLQLYQDAELFPHLLSTTITGHEELLWAATNRKGVVRLEAARRVLGAHRSGKLCAAFGRGSDFFGPGMLSSTAGDRMFLSVDEHFDQIEGITRVDPVDYVLHSPS
jgi:hypothetical protein